MQYIIGGLEKANIPYIEGGSTLHIPDYAERILKTMENRYSPIVITRKGLRNKTREISCRKAAECRTLYPFNFSRHGLHRKQSC